jgi:hypothetical protein
MGYRMTAALAIGLLGFVAAPPFASAVDTMIPPPPQQPSTTQKPSTPPANNTDTTKKKKKKEDASQQKSSNELFLDGYRAAHVLIYKRHNYEAGIVQLKALGHD